MCCSFLHLYQQSSLSASILPDALLPFSCGPLPPLLCCSFHLWPHANLCLSFHVPCFSLPPFCHTTLISFLDPSLHFVFAPSFFVSFHPCFTESLRQFLPPPSFLLLHFTLSSLALAFSTPLPFPPFLHPSFCPSFPRLYLHCLTPSLPPSPFCLFFLLFPSTGHFNIPFIITLCHFFHS